VWKCKENLTLKDFVVSAASASVSADLPPMQLQP
jgi:hypothetical protein